MADVCQPSGLNGGSCVGTSKDNPKRGFLFCSEIAQVANIFLPGFASFPAHNFSIVARWTWTGWETMRRRLWMRLSWPLLQPPHQPPLQPQQHLPQSQRPSRASCQPLGLVLLVLAHTFLLPVACLRMWPRVRSIEALGELVVVVYTSACLCMVVRTIEMMYVSIDRCISSPFQGVGS